MTADTSNTDRDFVCGTKIRGEMEEPSAYTIYWFGNTETADKRFRPDKSGIFFLEFNQDCEVSWWQLEEHVIESSARFTLGAIAAAALGAVIAVI